jgi:hypothetical protein
MSKEELEARISALEHFVVVRDARQFLEYPHPYEAMKLENDQVRQIVSKLGHQELEDALQALLAAGETLLQTMPKEEGY